MKTLNIPLEDTEFRRLKNKKGNKTWRNFIMELIDYDSKVE